MLFWIPWFFCIKGRPQKLCSLQQLNGCVLSMRWTNVCTFNWFLQIPTLTTVSITSESFPWDRRRLIMVSGTFSNSCWSVAQHMHTRPQSHTQLCHPSKQEDVGLSEDRFHVVAMVTAPLSWPDNRSRSNSTQQHPCVLRKLVLTMWLCFKSWKYNTSCLSQCHGTEGHWVRKVIHPSQKSI